MFYRTDFGSSRGGQVFLGGQPGINGNIHPVEVPQSNPQFVDPHAPQDYGEENYQENTTIL